MTNATAVPHTNIDGERNAHRHLRTDWDADGWTSVHLPHALAGELLRLRGWRQNDRGMWVSPASGETIWEREEALRLALLAECDIEGALARG